MKYCRFDGSATTKIMNVLGVLQLPRIAPLVVEESGIVVSFVKVFEDRGENFGFSIFI